MWTVNHLHQTSAKIELIYLSIYHKASAVVIGRISTISLSVERERMRKWREIWWFGSMFFMVSPPPTYYFVVVVELNRTSLQRFSLWCLSLIPLLFFFSGSSCNYSSINNSSIILFLVVIDEDWFDWPTFCFSYYYVLMMVVVVEESWRNRSPYLWSLGVDSIVAYWNGQQGDTERFENKYGSPQSTEQ